MVLNYQNADCSLKNKVIVSCVIIFRTLSFPVAVRERERGLFTMSEHNKYIYKLDNGRLPERNNHHSWPPMIIEKNNH